MTDVVVLHPDQLDYHARAVDLPDAPGPWSPVWSVRLQVRPGRSGLFRFGGNLALLNAPGGIVLLGPEPPSSQRALDGELLHAHRAVQDGPALVDSQGRVYRWTPGSPARQVWDVEASGTEVDVDAVAHDRMLLKRRRGGSLHKMLAKVGAGWILEIVDPETKGVGWQRTLNLRSSLPWHDSVFVIRYKRNSILRLQISDGQTMWERTVEGGVFNLEGIVGQTLWLITHDNEIVGIEVNEGQQTVRTRAPVVAVPSGIIDEQGRYHVCGSYYSVLDLRADARVLEQGPVSVRPGDTTMSLTFGSGAAYTTDGRVVFHDRNGGIFAVRADRFPKANLLRRPSSPLLGFGIAHRLLYVLTREGELSALRPEKHERER